jgi:hypothetical protein
MIDRPPWTPSRREQRLVWYGQMLMRYVIGGGGLVWELVIDQLHNSVALLVFGALATSTDVFLFVRTLIKQARGDIPDFNAGVEQTEEPDH